MASVSLTGDGGSAVTESVSKHSGLMWKEQVPREIQDKRVVAFIIQYHGPALTNVFARNHLSEIQIASCCGYQYSDGLHMMFIRLRSKIKISKICQMIQSLNTDPCYKKDKFLVGGTFDFEHIVPVDGRGYLKDSNVKEIQSHKGHPLYLQWSYKDDDDYIDDIVKKGEILSESLTLATNAHDQETMCEIRKEIGGFNDTITELSEYICKIELLEEKLCLEEAHLETSLGCVYAVWNPCFPELVKVGMTRRAMDARLKELNGCNVPEPFQVLATIQTINPPKLEKEIHAMLSTCRVYGKKKEFFSISKEEIKILFFNMDSNEEKSIIQCKSDDYIGSSPIQSQPPISKDVIFKRQLVAFFQGRNKRKNGDRESLAQTTALETSRKKQRTDLKAVKNIKGRKTTQNTKVQQEQSKESNKHPKWNFCRPQGKF